MLGIDDRVLTVTYKSLAKGIDACVVKIGSHASILTLVID